MKVLGCIGAGSFGKVLKVEIDGSIFAVKKVKRLVWRFSLNSTAMMIVGRFNRSKNRRKFSYNVSITPISFDIIALLGKETIIASPWSTSTDILSAQYSSPYKAKPELSTLSFKYCLHWGIWNELASSIGTLNLRIYLFLKKDFLR